MARKIKYHSLQLLFCLFAFLADKTKGWWVFVKPKLFLGSLILGAGLNSCESKDKKQSEHNNKSVVKSVQVNESIGLHQLIKSGNFLKSNPYCYVPVAMESKTNVTVTKQQYRGAMVSCYDTEIVEEKHPTNDSVYEVLKQMPDYPGGDIELLQFLRENIRIPAIDQESLPQGRVILRFVVQYDGSIGKIEILRSLDKPCDEEAIRVVKLMPKWIPGKLNGENVSVWYTLPVSFRFE